MSGNRSELYSAMVWVVSALTIFFYSTLALLGLKLPGVEELVYLLSNASGGQIYAAAFVAIFLEGLYFVGSFFPGSTLVILLATLAQFNGVWGFLVTICIIFIGWCMAGLANIFIANRFKEAVIENVNEREFKIKDRVWTTWFPAFRANYEVAQVTEGGKPWEVFFSSLRVKFWASGMVALCALAVPLIIDINELSNEEGFTSLAIVGIITLVVGITKIRHYYNSPDYKNKKSSRN